VTVRRLFLLQVASAGCVPKGTNEVLQVQLEATQIALSERTAKATVDVLRLEAEIARLGEEIAERQRQLDELVARKVLGDADLDRLTTTVAGLAAELERVRAELARKEADLARSRRQPVPEPAEPAVSTDPAPWIAAAIAARRAFEIDEARRAVARADDAAAFAVLVANGHAELHVREGATMLRIPTRLLFQEGFTTLSPRGDQIVAEVAAGLARVPGRRVTVEGHTDDAEVHTAELASNWDRGFSRAVAVVRALEGVPSRLSVASFAGTRPIADNATKEGRERNRRVELVIALDPDLPAAFDPTQAEERADEGP
jgi:chemotaxis protein MotB